MKTIFSKYRTKKASVMFIGFFSFLFIFSSCREKTIVPTDLIPEVDGIHTFEQKDWQMEIRNSYFDSAYTSNPDYAYLALGRISKDVFFGETNASMYMQVLPPHANFEFPHNTVIDSSAIILPFTGGIYGNRAGSKPARFYAYRINDDFKKDKGRDEDRKYYSFDFLNYFPTPLGYEMLFPEQVVSEEDTTQQEKKPMQALRIRLSRGFNQMMLQADPAHFANDTSFLDFFKGLYIAPDTTQNDVNFIALFSLYSVNSSNFNNARVEFYGRVGEQQDSNVVFTFQHSLFSSGYFNRIQRKYNGYPAAVYRNDNQTPRDTIMLQGAPGFTSEVAIKLDKDMPPAVINKATLTLTLLKNENDSLSYPNQLIIKGLDENGNEYDLADVLDGNSIVTEAGISFLSGTPKRRLLGNDTLIQYEINIPRELNRAILSQKQEIRLKIRANYIFPGTYRMLAAGSNTSDENRKLKFEVIYTKQ